MPETIRAAILQVHARVLEAEGVKGIEKQRELFRREPHLAQAVRTILLKESKTDKGGTRHQMQGTGKDDGDKLHNDPLQPVYFEVFANDGQNRLALLPTEILRQIFDLAFIPPNTPYVFHGIPPYDYNHVAAQIARDDSFPDSVRQAAREVVAKHIWLFNIDKVIHTTSVLAPPSELGRSVRHLMLSEGALTLRNELHRNPQVDEPRTAAQIRYAQRIARNYRLTLPLEERPWSCTDATLWARTMADVLALLKTMPALHDMLCYEDGVGLLPQETHGELARSGEHALALPALRKLHLVDQSHFVHQWRDHGLPLGLLDSGCALLHAVPRLEGLYLTGYERVLSLSSASSVTTNSVRDAGSIATHSAFPRLLCLKTLHIKYCPMSPEDLRAVLRMAGPHLASATIHIPRVLGSFRPDDSPDCLQALACGSHFAFTWQDVLGALAPWKDTTLKQLNTSLRVLGTPRDGTTPRLVLSGVHPQAIQRPTVHILNENQSPRQQPAMALLRRFSALRYLELSPDLLDWSIDQDTDILAEFNDQITDPDSYAERCDAYDHTRPMLAKRLVALALPRQLVSLTITQPVGYQTHATDHCHPTLKAIALGQAVVEAVRLGKFPNLQVLVVEPARHWDMLHDVKVVHIVDGEEVPTGQQQRLEMRWDPAYW
ncbi:hypothetical protein SCUCBS95973_001398 [Sporothrix curviconia]|uniref:Uncharacterized protein n=1 Tax=Sporothrix curviconia TaxID=1260050 RepID=A0ABP0AYA3_9PEZI